jgi:hypothetical protein
VELRRARVTYRHSGPPDVELVEDALEYSFERSQIKSDVDQLNQDVASYDGAIIALWGSHTCRIHPFSNDESAGGTNQASGCVPWLVIFWRAQDTSEGNADGVRRSNSGSRNGF